MKFDTFVATALFFAATIISFQAYREIQVVEHPGTSLLNSVVLGKHEYILSDSTRCVGSFTSNFLKDPGTTITSDGNFKFRLRGTTIDVKTFAGAFFNALNQLVALNISAEMPQARLDIHITNPSPMNIEILLNAGSRNFERKFTVPGPVLLLKNSDGSYRLDYLLLESVAGSMLTSIALSGGGEISGPDGKLQVLMAADTADSCKVSESTGYDLDPILTNFLRIAPQFNDFLKFLPKSGDSNDRN